MIILYIWSYIHNLYSLFINLFNYCTLDQIKVLLLFERKRYLSDILTFIHRVWRMYSILFCDYDLTQITERHSLYDRCLGIVFWALCNIWRVNHSLYGSWLLQFLLTLSLTHNDLIIMSMIELTIAVVPIAIEVVGISSAGFIP